MVWWSVFTGHRMQGLPSLHRTPSVGIERGGTKGTMASSSTDTEATFVALLKELGLFAYNQKFEDNGWMTLQDFAAACLKPSSEGCLEGGWSEGSTC